MSAPAACRLCGCTELNACPGGCAWVMPGICSSCAPQLLRPVKIELTLLSVMAVHGNLCLALRHPENVGTSREITEAVLATCEQILIETGVLSAEMVQEIHAHEIAEQPRIVLPGRG